MVQNTHGIMPSCCSCVNWNVGQMKQNRYKVVFPPEQLPHSHWLFKLFCLLVSSADHLQWLSANMQCCGHKSNPSNFPSSFQRQQMTSYTINNSNEFTTTHLFCNTKTAPTLQNIVSLIVNSNNSSLLWLLLSCSEILLLAYLLTLLGLYYRNRLVCSTQHCMS